MKLIKFYYQSSALKIDLKFQVKTVFYHVYYIESVCNCEFPCIGLITLITLIRLIFFKNVRILSILVFIWNGSVACMHFEVYCGLILG